MAARLPGTAATTGWSTAPLSATGKPLLANDPHRALTLPSLRYMVHLVAPGWNVIGAGEPALPGVSAGHNDRVAFGFTIAMIDQQDLYVEETNPANPDEVRFQGRWEPMRVVRETIGVKGGEPVAAELKFTRHGPVIHEDRERHRAYVLRWVGSEPGTAGYLASLSLDRARDWPEFRQGPGALEGPVGEPGLRGRGRQHRLAGGGAHARAQGVVRPAAGAGRGRVRMAGISPRRRAAGRLQSARGTSSPPPTTTSCRRAIRDELGYDWGDPTRFLRIAEILGAGGRRGANSRSSISSASERRGLAVGPDVGEDARRGKGAGPELRPWIEKLARWDGTLAKGSAAGGSLRDLGRQARARGLQGARAQRVGAVRRRPDPGRSTSSVNPKPDWFGSDPKAGRDAVLLSSLEAAVAEAKTKLGPDLKTWRWGACIRPPSSMSWDRP